MLVYQRVTSSGDLFNRLYNLVFEWKNLARMPAEKTFKIADLHDSGYDGT